MDTMPIDNTSLPVTVYIICCRCSISVIFYDFCIVQVIRLTCLLTQCRNT